MKMVIDANVLFSFFKRSSFTRDLILFHPEIELYVPYFVFEELISYKKLIIEKAGIDERVFEITIEEIRHMTQTVPLSEIVKNWERAKDICPDPDDIQYFASAIELDCIIWSNDKKLKEQELVLVVNTNELSLMLGSDV